MQTAARPARSRNASILVLLGILVAGAAVAEPVTFTLENGTEATLMEFYASPPGVEDWEEDILGDDVLGAGDVVEITIADGREDCEYDFLGVFEDEEGESYEIMHEAVEVCDGETYVYTE